MKIVAFLDRVNGQVIGFNLGLGVFMGAIGTLAWGRWPDYLIACMSYCEKDEGYWPNVIFAAIILTPFAIAALFGLYRLVRSLGKDTWDTILCVILSIPPLSFLGSFAVGFLFLTFSDITKIPMPDWLMITIAVAMVSSTISIPVVGLPFTLYQSYRNAKHDRVMKRRSALRIV